MADRASLGERIASAAFLAIMRSARLLPYRVRIPLIGWLVARIFGPLAGWSGRARTNMARAMPMMPGGERKRACREVLDNAGRSMAEIYSGREFTARIRQADPLTGPGLSVLEEAANEGRAVVLACAHFGNYDAMRAAIAARGWPIGALYRPMSNASFNAHYIPAMESIAQPMFPRGRSGLVAMIGFLRDKGMLALGFDQFVQDGVELQFFGLPTRTTLTPAQLALRNDALLIPIAGRRLNGGLDFAVEVGLPIATGSPEEMMQSLNDDLERRVRAYPGQWFWVHRRWKP